MVGFIFIVKTEGTLLAGSVNAATNQPRPLSKTVRTPTAEAVWGKKTPNSRDELSRANVIQKFWGSNSQNNTLEI